MPTRSVRPRSAGAVARPAASLKAVNAAFCAFPATASAWCFVPGLVINPGGNPVIAVPGLTPTFKPLMVEVPVLVTVDPPSTPKVPAVPKPTVGTTAACATPPPPTVMATPITRATVDTKPRPTVRAEEEEEDELFMMNRLSTETHNVCT